MNAVAWSERFVALPENRAALVAIEGLAERIVRGEGASDESSLLVLHGPPGTGKTFLVQLLLELLADCTSLVVSAREAHDNFRAALEVREEPAGRGKKPRAMSEADDPLAVALLVVEDLQFLPLRTVERFIGVLDRRERLGLATVV